MLNYRKLGNTGLKVSEIGFGCWGIGGNSYGATDDGVSKKALWTAYDYGINFFDTSDLYGHGKSESLLGETFRAERKNIIIATKVGALQTIEEQNFSANYIFNAIEKSLQRLKTDYIDLYQLHNPAPEVLEKDDSILKALTSLQKQGKIRAYGISVRQPQDALVFIKKFAIPSIQVNFNLLDQRAKEVGLFDLAQSHGVGIIARTPLCFGFLSGKYSESTFTNDDHRSTWSGKQLEVWSQGINKFSIPDKNKETEAQFALRFCISHPVISSAIPGMLTPEHVLENSAAANLGPMSNAELSDYYEIYRNNNFFIRK